MEQKNSALDRGKFWEQADQNYIDRLQGVNCCLVMVPHPDDESLACAGLITMLVERGVDIQVILTTDGSMSHPNSKNYPSEKLFELRKRELQEALALMGVRANAIQYYKVKDGSMSAIDKNAFSALVIKLVNDLEAIQPDLILVPYELDSHSDHKATHQLLHTAINAVKIPQPKIWEYPIWLYERATLAEVPTLQKGELIAVDITSYLPLKKKCIYAHRSQTILLIDDDPNGFMLDAEVIDNFLQDKEYFMERAKLNPSTLSKEYFDNVYANSSDPWNFETSDYEREKYLTTINAIPAGSYPKAFEIGCSIGVLTEKLLERCDHLLAMDISAVAIQKAQERLAHKQGKVDFVLGSLPADFPQSTFDLIVMSEVGYYFATNELLTVRQQIWEALSPNGILVLVHWIHYVHDYPNTGDAVHNYFSKLKMSHLKAIRTADYRLDVFRKL